MDISEESIILAKTNVYVNELHTFLNDDKYKTQKNCPYTNIIDQAEKRTYCIDFIESKNENNEFSLNMNNLDIFHTPNDKNINFITPMDKFMYKLENCRKSGVILGFSESQNFTIKNVPFVDKKEFKKLESNSESDSESDELDDELDEESDESDQESVEESNESNKNNSMENDSNMAELKYIDIPVIKSGIDLDFDIYQKEETRVISTEMLFSLFKDITLLIFKTLNIASAKKSQYEDIRKSNDDSFITYGVILKKPNVVEVDKKEYGGKCFKESFRFRYPGIKISKEHKKYIIRLIDEKNILANNLYSINILTPWDKIIDPMSGSHPLLFLGNAKKRSKIAHELDTLYFIKYFINYDNINVSSSNEFKPTFQETKIIKIKDPSDRRKKIDQKIPIGYKYNLCYELSINFESPNGLIKKYEFDPKPELETEIRTSYERTADNLIPKSDIEDIKNNVADLTVRNSDAKYLQSILDIIDKKRVQNYDDWRWVIYILAWTNPDYKPLAIWFSYRYPASWSNGGPDQFEKNWEWAIAHPMDETESKKRTINTIYSWAKEDNPEKYDEIQKFNVFIKLKRLIFKELGKLNETHIALVLQVMFGKKFICDENPRSNAKTGDRRWYEFVFPNDDLGRKKEAIYKWRRETGRPDSLDKFISTKLGDYIDKVHQWIESQIAEKEIDESKQKTYELIKKNISDLKNKLGTATFISKVLSRCEVFFRDRGFEESLDTDQNVIGVENGVLKLFPQTEIIQRYHDIPITRSTAVDYEKYNPENSHVILLENEIKRLFAGQDDAYEKTMCYLASSLDSRKKQPLFYIWLGEGQNGKSFLLEMHISALKEVVRGGYGAKLNSDFFIKERKSSGGPDSEKMMLKYARFAYCSESEEGAVLLMSKIKEFTSETLSGNEKHQTQDMFEANCPYVFCTNHDPRITGRDWGTWRRIWVYRFKMRFLPNPDPNNPYEYKEDRRFSDTFTKDPEYKKAYFSILVKYYEIFRDKYKSNLNNIQSSSIDRDTRDYQSEQDTIARFIHERVIHVGEYYKNKSDPNTGEPLKVSDIPINDLVLKYLNWYGSKIDGRAPIKSEVIKAFKSCKITKYFKENFNNLVLTQCHILGNNEIWEEPIDSEQLEQPTLKILDSNIKNGKEEDSDIDKEKNIVKKDENSDDEYIDDLD